MSYESEIEALIKERKLRGLAILEKYKNATPEGVLDNYGETKEFRELSAYVNEKLTEIKKKYGKKVLPAHAGVILKQEQV